ncbi:hypothetical protein [Streptomyces sp. NPDC093223]|uniref:hypothetical protein n=1 Tax=Streptomyces sp. NPDC093223 TaxID=3366033 RepID=UPI0037F287BF
MGHRPYPNRERALKQFDRHIDEVGPMLQPRPLTPLERQVAGNAGALLRAAQPSAALAMARLRAAFTRPVGEYRLSTRPDVSAGS